MCLSLEGLEIYVLLNKKKHGIFIQNFVYIEVNNLL